MKNKRKTPSEAELIKASILLGIREEDLLLALEMLDSLKRKLERIEKENPKNK
jgi:hypothetical protein